MSDRKQRWVFPFSQKNLHTKCAKKRQRTSKKTCFDHFRLSEISFDISWVFRAASSATPNHLDSKINAKDKGCEMSLNNKNRIDALISLQILHVNLVLSTGNLSESAQRCESHQFTSWNPQQPNGRGCSLDVLRAVEAFVYIGFLRILPRGESSLFIIIPLKKI